MIELRNVSKRYRVKDGWRTVLNQINLSLRPGQKLGILGRNGAGKSTLVRLLGGVEQPTSGQIVKSMSISWPLALSGGFQGSLTGMDNLRFISRVYDVDEKFVLDFVQGFAELGKYLYEPVSTYSSGMRARLAFALSMAIDFDCYLIDEVIAVGDSKFVEKCQIELFEKRKDSAMIFVSHNYQMVKKYCDSASVLDNGHLYPFDAIGLAYRYYSKL